MSNEELVAEIQAGEDCMTELWGQVRGFVAERARRIMPALEGRADVEIEDLIQSGYFALVSAVAAYRSGEVEFLTYLGYHLKTAFSETTRFRSLREQRETKATVLSLDAPLTGDGGEGLTLGDRIQDPGEEAQLEAVEDQIWLVQLQKAVADAFQEMPAEQRELLRLRFWDKKTLKELSQSLSVSIENVRQRERKALQTLRRPHVIRLLRPYYDFDYYSGASLTAFRNSGMSIQDRYLILEENCQDRRDRHR